MIPIKIISDDSIEKKKIYGCDHLYYEFNQNKFSNQIVVCVNVLEHFNNIELLKFSLWCKKHKTRIIAYGNLNEFPLFGIIADAAIMLYSDSDSIYEGSTHYACKSDIVNEMMSESIYFPARMSFLNERYWHINGIESDVNISDDYIGCHVINLCKSNYEKKIKPMHFILDIACKEISDEEVVDYFCFPTIHIRETSLLKYKYLRSKGILKENCIVGEIKRGDGCGGDHLKSILVSKIDGYELPFVLELDELNEICKFSGSNYMEVQLLASFLSNWMWICYGGSSSIFSFLPVKVLSLSDSMCIPELSRKISIARFGHRLGSLFPEFETLIYCMPGAEDGESRADGQKPLPNIRDMVKEFSKAELKFTFSA